uniref:Redoxin domain-containing protein n=1 Tax=candidate division WOR-3 bacterium TaxID=2052148 RepID=A0A7C4GHT2_UNCW3
MKRRLCFGLLVGLTALLPATALATLRVGDPAPDFSIPDSTGAMRSLSEFRGRVVQILFWANF